MDRTFTAADVQTGYKSTANPLAPVSEESKASYVRIANDAANENLDGCELKEGCEPLETHLTDTDIDEPLTIEHWKPAEPQFCKAIAEHYQQSKRTIQKWFVDLRALTPWFAESTLRLSDDRYTPLAVELLGERYFAGSRKKWEQFLADRYAEQIAVSSAATTQYSVFSLPETHASQSYEVVDGETVEEGYGSLTTSVASQQALPIIQFNFQNLNVNLAAADTTPLHQQTQQAQSITAQAAGLLQQAVSAKFKADMAQVIAQNENLAAGIQATAVLDAMQDLGLGKPVVAVASPPSG